MPYSKLSNLEESDDFGGEALDLQSILEGASAKDGPVTLDTEVPETDGTVTLDDSDGTADILPDTSEESVEGAAAKKAPETVPLEALKDERTKRQVLEDKLAQLTARFDRVIDSMITGQQQAQQPKVEEGPAIPDWNTDPLGFLKVSIELLGEKIKGVTETQKTTVEQTNAANQNISLAQRFHADIAAYRSKVPNFDKALNFLADNYNKELLSIGYSEQEALQIISADAKGIVDRAYKAGKNPAKVMYDRAVSRGYREEATPTAEPAADPVPSKQNLAKGLGSASGKAVRKVTSDHIAQMNEDQFESFMKGRSWEKLMS